jgi:hypothetical protein
MPDDETPETALIPDSVYIELAADINRLHRKTSIELALAVGQMVLDRLYAGDLKAWRERASKDGSLIRLAAEIKKLGNKGFSPSTLSNAVGTLDLDRRVGVAGRPQLTASHVRAVIGLPEDKQEALLGNAEAKDWSVEKLKNEAAKIRSKTKKSKGGRTPQPAALKTIRGWQRDLDDEGALAEFEKLAELDADAQNAVKETLQALMARCQEWLSALP